MQLKKAGIKGISVLGTKGSVWIYAATGVPFIEINRKNSQVGKLYIDVPNLEYSFTGYFPVDSNLGKSLQTCSEEELLVTVLFEQKRKKDIDENIPIEKLRENQVVAKENTVKTVGGIFSWKDKTWILSEESTVIKENIPNEWTHEVIQRSQTEDYSLDNIIPTEEPPKPNVTMETDEKFLLINYYMFVKDMENKYEYSLSEERRRLIAKKLLKLANGIQIKTTNIQIPNYKDYSHTKARGLIFQVIERFVPLNKVVETDEGLNTFIKNVLDKSLELLEW